MNCFICENGDYIEGKTTLSLNRDNQVMLVTDIPALVCNKCGESLFTPDVSRVLYEATNEMFNMGDTNTVISYEQLEKVPA